MDWLSSALGLTGCWLLGRGVKHGWLLYATSSAINAFLGFNAGLLGVAVGGVIYCILEVKGYVQHQKTQQKS